MTRCREQIQKINRRLELQVEKEKVLLHGQNVLKVLTTLLESRFGELPPGAYKIEPSGSVTSMGEHGSMKSLHEAVGGVIELVKIGRKLSADRILVVNEDGQARSLPVNPVASWMVGQAIQGTVVMLWRVGFDEWTSTVAAEEEEA